jgi:hypothetical protein
MNTKILAVMLSSLSFATLAACNRAEAPAETASDVAEARQDAAKDLADERRDAAREMGSAAAEMRESAQDVEETRIEGERKVALEKCEALAGEAQKACKDSADATYESARSRLKTQMSPSGATTGSSGATAAPGTVALPPPSTPTR